MGGKRIVSGKWLMVGGNGGREFSGSESPNPLFGSRQDQQQNQQ
jgi:hypothetical protein